METWKLLLGVAALLAMFTAIVSLGGPDLSLPVLIGIFVLLLIGLAITIRSYRFGQRIGSRMAEDRDE